MGWMGMPTTVDAMPGMATEAELDAFGARRAAPTPIACSSISWSITTRVGIHMAEVAAAEAELDVVRSMADAITGSQGDEIGELERLID